MTVASESCPAQVDRRLEAPRTGRAAVRLLWVQHFQGPRNGGGRAEGSDLRPGRGLHSGDPQLITETKTCHLGVGRGQGQGLRFPHVCPGHRMPAHLAWDSLGPGALGASLDDGFLPGPRGAGLCRACCLTLAWAAVLPAQQACSLAMAEGWPTRARLPPANRMLLQEGPNEGTWG